MISRIFIVAFIVSFSLLSGRSADATPVTEHIQFKIQSIVGTRIFEDNSQEDISGWSEIWEVGDVFNVSLTYDDSFSSINYYNGDPGDEENEPYYTVSKNFFASDAVYDIEIKRDDFLQSIDNLGRNWHYIQQSDDNLRQLIGFKQEKGNLGLLTDIFKIDHHLMDPIPYYAATFEFRDYRDFNNRRKWTITAHSVVPEPSTWVLLGTGLAGLAYYRRKKS